MSELVAAMSLLATKKEEKEKNTRKTIKRVGISKVAFIDP